ncbi:hypothetical protein G730_02494 [Escherichia coli HVH 59 (4-1119338)]|nr:hypothetical protein G730_02494 [Escherichia coli HVH 59 (4-1119338)]
MRQGNDYEHRFALKGNVLFAIFYLGELAGYPRFEPPRVSWRVFYL